MVKTHEAFAEEIGNVERQYCLLEVVICEGHSMQLSYTRMGERAIHPNVNVMSNKGAEGGRSHHVGTNHSLLLSFFFKNGRIMDSLAIWLHYRQLQCVPNSDTVSGQVMSHLVGIGTVYVN